MREGYQEREDLSQNNKWAYYIVLKVAAAPSVSVSMYQY